MTKPQAYFEPSHETPLIVVFPDEGGVESPDYWMCYVVYPPNSGYYDGDYFDGLSKSPDNMTDAEYEVFEAEYTRIGQKQWVKK